MKRRMRELRAYFEGHASARAAAIAALALCALLLQYLQLQISTVQNVHFLEVSPVNLLVNLALVAIPTGIFALFFRGLTLPLALSGALYTLWSVANVYVITYHGSPLFLNELLHARDAAEVISGYSFKLHVGVLALLFVGAGEAVCLAALHGLRPRGIASAPRRAAIRLTATVLCAAFALLCLYGPAPTKPRVALTSSYRTAVRRYGFMACLVEDAYKLLNPFAPPEGYDPEALRAGEPQPAAAPEKLPDIVLLLNESFYDPRVYTELEADADFLAAFYRTPNARFGYALSPREAYGTNDSEYELLTSNSIFPLQSSAPFNFLNMEAPGNSLARYLKTFGYESWGMHPGSPKGYSRGIGYPQLGFDHILLGPDAFEHHSCYGARNWLDWDNFQDLIAQYESAEGPRFLYLLTYQNHGGYEQNDASLDAVHSRTDFGDLTDDMDEYLTSVSMSAEAFRQLTDYFAASERPVIVCMVGDHAPTMINSLPAREADAERASLRKRLVPYAIWANYDAPLPEAEVVSMVDLGPMLLRAAGLPLSAYYEAILALQETFPVRLSTGRFLDASGEFRDFDPDAPEQFPLAQYYYMEYNSLKGGEDYRAELFRAPVE